MSYRVLILRAGSGMANNVIRSLRAGDPSLEIVGCHDDPFVLEKSTADRNRNLPFDRNLMMSGLDRIVTEEAIDLLIPVTDEDVLAVSQQRSLVKCVTFLPAHETIALCQDKFSLSEHLRKNGLPVAETYEIHGIDDVEAVFSRFEGGTKLWCRARAGTGSFAAIPVVNADQVRAWIAYWSLMRNVRADAFTLSEYLPGADYYVQSLWLNGALILTKMAERLTYLDNGSPSGKSSLSSLARTALREDVVEIATEAIRVVDAHASGVFFIDVKRNAGGQPCVTEINAGRFTIGTNLLDLVGQWNMCREMVQLAMTGTAKMRGVTDYLPNWYSVRAIDTIPKIVDGSTLFSMPIEVASPHSSTSCERST